MPNNVQLTTDALNDLSRLSADLQSECWGLLNKLSRNIYLGQALEDKNGIDLSDCYKLYFNHAKHRVVYRIVEGSAVIEGISPNLSIAEVLGIGRRDKLEIYRLVAERLKRMKGDDS